MYQKEQYNPLLDFAMVDGEEGLRQQLHSINMCEFLLYTSSSSSHLPVKSVYVWM
jgi:hypothetical protein